MQFDHSDLRDVSISDYCHSFRHHATDQTFGNRVEFYSNGVDGDLVISCRCMEWQRIVFQTLISARKCLCFVGSPYLGRWERYGDWWNIERNIWNIHGHGQNKHKTVEQYWMNNNNRKAIIAEYVMVNWFERVFFFRVDPAFTSFHYCFDGKFGIRKGPRTICGTINLPDSTQFRISESFTSIKCLILNVLSLQIRIHSALQWQRSCRNVNFVCQNASMWIYRCYSCDFHRALMCF